MPPTPAPPVSHGPSEKVGPHTVFLVDAKQDYPDLLVEVEEFNSKLKKARNTENISKKVDLLLNDVLVQAKSLFHKMTLGLAGLHDANVETWEAATGETSVVMLEDVGNLTNICGHGHEVIGELLESNPALTPEQRKKLTDLSDGLKYLTHWAAEYAYDDGDGEDGDEGDDEDDDDGEDEDDEEGGGSEH